MAFDPKKHVIRVQGNREYLPVSARLIWFRQEHPDWSIITSPVEINLEKQYAIFSASIMNSEGKIMATGTKMENIKGFGDYIEKAETGSVGRALAMCGFGAQFAPEMEEGGRFADAPQGPMSAGNRFAARPNGAPNGNFANRTGPAPARPNALMNGNGNGNGNRPPMPMSAPAEDENPFDSAATAPPERQQPSRPAAPVQAEARPSAPSPQREPVMQRETAPQREPMPQREVAPQVERSAPPAPRPANNGGGIVRERVKEPEYTDPGGDDEPEGPEGLGDDPFEEEFVAPAPAPRMERPVEMPPTQLGGNRPNPMANSLACSSPGCTAKLTPSQVTLSTQKAGKPLCVLHLREAMNSGQAANALL